MQLKGDLRSKNRAAYYAWLEDLRKVRLSSRVDKIITQKQNKKNLYEST